MGEWVYDPHHRHTFTIKWTYDWLDRLLIVPWKIKKDKLCQCGASQYLYKNK